ncbi:MAG: serine/threonine-protein kinase [Thermoanaerobaculales bacterium]|jgi:serine/threonine-protein kinase|nr:serine/threonine-protein kinase [Thermoanaerobaculales bacterium]
MNDIPSDREPPDLGDRYEVETLLGEGSMGRVWRAFDRQLNRFVAVKVLRSSDPNERARFQREAKAQASIRHEHVCRVFDVGEEGGHAFLAMQLVEGSTLLEVSPGLELAAKAGIMEQVARAVQAAHLDGVVHRDLNPRNIMVEQREDGTLHAFVMDFGIARPPGEAEDDGRPATAGSPAYMAPEQLGCEHRFSNELADVYAVGAILYAVLGEQAPFFGATREATEAAVLGAEPLRLGLIVPGLPADLEAITEKAMNREPQRRFSSAGQIADDLGRWRKGLPIVAGTEKAGGRLLTWVRARWVVVTAAAVTVALLATASMAMLWRERQADRLRSLENRYRNEVEQIDRLLRRARMMPLHDTAPAEAEVQRRLAAMEADLIEHGSLGKGPAHYALGFGHLMLREFGVAEEWLRAAVRSGFDAPEVETALGVAVAMQQLEAPPETPEAARARIDEAVRLLTARGPRTRERDLYHLGLSLLVSGRLDQALEAVQESRLRTPWLVEAFQLEGDILMARSRRRLVEGDRNGALNDLREAGDAYGRGLAVARSDPWLRRAELGRLTRLLELQQQHLGVGVSEVEIDALRTRIAAFRAAGVALDAGNSP